MRHRHKKSVHEVNTVVLKKNKIDMETYCKLLALFERYDTFALSTHIHPDGDAIGSELGLYFFLKRLGKSVKMFNTDGVPPNYRFLPFSDSIEGLSSVGGYRPELLVILDASRRERIGTRLSKTLKPLHTVVNIDHHATGVAFGDINLIEPSASSTSEIIYRLIKARSPSVILNRQSIGTADALEQACALCLYTGIMFDTGCFRYSNASAETHQIAADLIEIGDFAPDEVYRNVYEQVPIYKMRLLSKILGTLSVTENGKIASVYATQEMFNQAGATTDEVEGVVNQIQAIAGVEVALCVTELEDGSTKVSLRSQGSVDVGALAAEFNGGGHERASGCRIGMPYLLAIAALVATAERYIARNEKIAFGQRLH